MLTIDMSRIPSPEERDAAYKLVWREAVGHKSSEAYEGNPSAKWYSPYYTQVMQALESAAISLINEQQEKESNYASAMAKLEAPREKSLPPSEEDTSMHADGECAQGRNALRRANKARIAEVASKLEDEDEAAKAKAEAARAKYDLQRKMRLLASCFDAWMAPLYEAVLCVDPTLVDLVSPFKSNAVGSLKSILGGIQAVEGVSQTSLEDHQSGQAALGPVERAVSGGVEPASDTPFANLDEKEGQDV